MSDFLASPPPPEPTPAEAAAKLDTLRADPAWRDGFLRSGPAQMKEYTDLSAIAAKAGGADDARISMAMAGQYLPGMNDSEHLQRMGTASMLREAGLTDDVVRQVLTGQPVSKAEHEAATRRKAALMGDREWTAKMSQKNGDYVSPQYTEYMLLTAIICAPVKEENAA